MRLDTGVPDARGKTNHKGELTIVARTIDADRRRVEWLTSDLWLHTEDIR